MLKSGFVAHPITSEWTLKQEEEHLLGFLVDLKQGLFYVPPKKVTSLKRKLQQFCSSQKTTARRISSLVGTVVSLGIAIGPVARMWTRSLYALVYKLPSWDSPITLSDKASAELIEFWSLCFEKFNGNHIWPTSPIVNVMSYSDSSNFTWGGYIVQIADHVAKGSFTEVEAAQSSTWKELQGTFYLLSSYLKQLQSMVVKH